MIDVISGECMLVILVLAVIEMKTQQTTETSKVLPIANCSSPSDAPASALALGQLILSA